MNSENGQNENGELPPLSLGEKVPSLNELVWIKGKPTKIGSNLTIVECWATWCGPCLQTIPHLAELQRKYNTKLEIIGITQEEKEIVIPFVENMGEKMDYRVGIAPDSIYETYMSGIAGIPHAFLIDRDGTLIWHSHPGEIEPILDAYIGGSITSSNLMELGKYKNSYDALLIEIVTGENQNELIRKLIPIAVKMLEILPNQPELFRSAVYHSNFLGEFDLLESLCHSIDIDSTSPESLVSFVNIALLEFTNLKSTLSYSIDWLEFALEKKPNEPLFLDVYAKLLYSIGLLDTAISIQKKAVSLDSKDYSTKLEFYLNLKELQKKIKK